MAKTLLTPSVSAPLSPVEQLRYTVPLTINQSRQNPNTQNPVVVNQQPTPEGNTGGNTGGGSNDNTTTSTTDPDTSASGDASGDTTSPANSQGFTVDDNFNNFTLDEKIDHLKKNQNDLSEDQKKQLTDLEKEKEKIDEHSTNKVGKVKGPFDDPDYGDPEKTKFDIQQGDFLEFIMKEIVIASTAWGCDKACGYTGLYMYRTLSAVYHGGKKYMVNPAVKEYQDLKDDLKKSMEKTNEEVKKAQVKKDEFTIKPTDDRTTKFAKEIYQHHNSLIQKNEIFENGDHVYKMISAAIDGKLNEITINDKNGNPIDKNSPMYQMLLQVTENTKNMKNPQLAKDQLTDIIMRKSAEMAMVNTFSSSYATAKIIELKSKSPEEFNNEKSAEVYQKYLLQGRKMFFIEAEKMGRGNSKYKDPNDMLADSVEALQSARENIKKGNYLENKGKVPENKKLTKLDNLYEGTSSNIRDKELESLINAAVPNQLEATMLSNLEQASREEVMVNAQRLEHEAKKKPQKKNPDNTNTPTPTRGGNTK